MTTRYHRENIRKLLLKGFNEEELRRFCFDHDNFRSFLDRVPTITAKAEFISKLIEYIEQKGLIIELLEFAQQNNNVRYENYRPYIYLSNPCYLEPLSDLTDRYKIYDLIGEGGMGAVYKGFDKRLKRLVAIKQNCVEFQESIEQFELEAVIQASLQHNNLPQIYDHFPHNNEWFLVMEYIEGQDLGNIIEKGGRPLEQKQALDYILQICDAVGYLHKQEPPVIHRDIKPKNIKITPKERAVLVDFGIAKRADNEQTHLGAKGYSLHFASPEQVNFQPTTPASDIYSLSATLYYILTHGLPTLPLNSDKLNTLNPQLAKAIVKAMERNSQDRPQTVDEWQAELKAVQDRLSKAFRDNLSEGTQLSPSRRRNEPSKPNKFLLLVIGTIIVALLLGAIARCMEIGIKNDNATKTSVAATVTTQAQMTAEAIKTATSIWATAQAEATAKAITLATSCQTEGMVKVAGQITPTLISDFCLDQYEVTNKEYEECVKEGSCNPPVNSSSHRNSTYYGSSEFEDYPVVYVSWHNAQAYCEFAGKQKGIKQRLPKAVEWDLARSRLDSTPELLTFIVAFTDTHRINLDSNVDITTEQVYDLAGNVQEWVEDPVAEGSSLKIVKGGSFFENNPEEMNPQDSDKSVGFRCAWDGQ